MKLHHLCSTVLNRFQKKGWAMVELNVTWGVEVFPEIYKIGCQKKMTMGKFGNAAIKWRGR